MARQISKEKMIESIAKGKYCIAKEYVPESGGHRYLLGKGTGQNMNFVNITDERAKEWLDLGAEMIYL